MPYGDTEAPAMGVGGKGLSGPCCKKLKSAEGPCAPCRCSGRADLPRVQEPGATPAVPASDHPQGKRSSPVGGPGPEPHVPPHAPLAGVGPQTPADDGIYSTSKAFIGPLYKPPEKKKAGDRKKDTGRRGRGPGGRGEKPLSATPKPELDSELCQFYREIEELEQETDDLDAGCQAAAAPIHEQLTAGQDLRRGFLRAAEEEEQGQFRAMSGIGQQPMGLEPGSYPDHGQAASRPLCNGPMTSFPHLGRPLPPFLVPHGPPPPPLPTFNCHLNFRRFHPLPYPPLPHPALHMFPAHEGSPLRGNGCSAGPPSWGCPTLERPSEHPDCLGGHRGTPPCGGVPGLPEGLGRSSLGGATEGHWMDLPLDRWPDGDLPVDRWPGGDLPVDGWPGRDLPVDGWPGGDLPMDRWPRVDVPVDSWMPGVDLPMDRCPRADVIGDRWPRGDMPVDRWLPGVDLPMDRYARADVTEDRWPRGDLPVDSWSGVDVHLPPPQQTQEEKLEKWQKLLILLRGLPGSGKTTLSRSLLGESPEGIVFSTDDYFRCQDGYRYNVNQLGDAHDWNQSRAKEAISQGRSPIIIDNTNTQAWEMRPYVEMAIGQGYRVEFHEPETWWKFDPEELEKRNKHGVSRKKIAQMLERYEFDVSPALVMNAVEPSQKSSLLRPPPPEWRPRESDRKEPGRGLGRPKRRDRRGNKLHRRHRDATTCLTPGAQEAGESEESDFEDARREPSRAVPGGPGSGRGACLRGSKARSRGNAGTEEVLPNAVSGLEPFGRPPRAGGHSLWSSSLVPSGRSGTHLDDSLPHVTSEECAWVKVHQDGPPGAPAVPLRHRRPRCRPRAPRPSHQLLPGEQGANPGRTSRTSDWAFFSTSLSEEEAQWASAWQPSSGSWPEAAGALICDQRLKKDRWRGQACPSGRGDLDQPISISEGAPGPGSSPELSTEKRPLMEDRNVSRATETEADPSRNHLPAVGSPERALVPRESQNSRELRAASVTAGSDLRGQAGDGKARGEVLLFIESHGLKIVVGVEEGRTSETNHDQEAPPGPHAVQFHLDILRGPSLVLGRQFSPRSLSSGGLRYSVCFSRNPVPSLGLQLLPRFSEAALTSRCPCLPAPCPARAGPSQEGPGSPSSERSSRQPQASFSFSVTSDWHFLRDGCSPKDSSRELARAQACPFRLLLSRQFALQLAKLFGSPGVLMDQLRPEDLMVSLDMRTLRRVHVQWGDAVEKKQKKAE